MKRIIDDTDLNLIADDILASVRMLELADEDTAEDDLDVYLPKIRKAAEDLNGIAANSAEVQNNARVYTFNPGDNGIRTGSSTTEEPTEKPTE